MNEHLLTGGSASAWRRITAKTLSDCAETADKLVMAALYSSGSPRPLSHSTALQAVAAKLREAAEAVGGLKIRKAANLPPKVLAAVDEAMGGVPDSDCADSEGFAPN